MDKQKITAFAGGSIISVGADNLTTTYEAMLVKGGTIAYLGDRDGLEKLITEDVEVSVEQDEDDDHLYILTFSVEFKGESSELSIEHHFKED